MEFWIFIVVSIIGVLIISTIAIIVRCVGYKKVVKKIRSRTISYTQGAQDPESGRQPSNVVLPPPPAYAICFQHPIIARSSAAPSTDSEHSYIPDPEISTTDQETSSLESESSSGSEEIYSGSAFPADADFFVPPPYCLEPPAYSDVTDTPCPIGSLEAPEYTEY